MSVRNHLDIVFALLLLADLALGKPSISWRGSYHFPSGSARSIVLNGQHAYVFNGWTRGDGILVYDLRDRENPRFVGSLPARGYLKQGILQEKEATLFVPASFFSVMVVDVEKPDTPILLRNLFYNFREGNAQSIAVGKNRLYIGGRGTGGLNVLDVSVPKEPLPIANWPQFGHVSSIDVDGDLILMSHPRSQITLAVVTNDVITETANFKLAGQGQLISPALYQSTARELVVHDLTDPANPKELSRWPGIVALARPRPNRLLAATPTNTLAILDVSKPLTPLIERYVSLADLGISAKKVRDIAIEDDLLVWIDQDNVSLRLIDIAGASAVELGKTYIMRNAGHLALTPAGDPILSYTHNTNTTLFPITKEKLGYVDLDSCHQMPVASRADALPFHDVHRSAAIASIGDYLLHGDAIVDCSDLKNLKTLHPLTRVANDIAVHSNKAAIVQGSRVLVLDISALPERKLIAQHEPTENTARYMAAALNGDFLYLVNQGPKTPLLEIHRVSAGALLLVGSCEIPPSLSIAYHGSYLYLGGAGGGDGLAIVDATDPAAPVFVKIADGIQEGVAYRARIHRGRLYFTDSLRGIKEVDLDDPLNPIVINQFLGTTATNPSYTDFGFHDNKLYGLRFSNLDVWQLDETPWNIMQPTRPFMAK